MTSASVTAIPIFIISFNRGDYLKNVMRSYQAQDVEVEIVIHDNGSTDRETLRTLDRLSSSGSKVYRYAAISEPEELNKVDISVQRYARETGYDGPYVVTDCDIDLSGARPDALRTYVELLERFPDAECVGPMLRISDIPRSYPLFNRVMARHIAQFWGRQPQWIDLPVGKVAYLEHRIDTTFAVHRAGSAFRRLKPGIRVYHPFEARHLDWYVTSDGPDRYRTTSSSAISHWDNEDEFRKYAAFPPATSPYMIVEGALGALKVAVLESSENPA
ncbi:MAG: glycosyltransferase family A protein [Sphingomicrobium sp.]